MKLRVASRSDLPERSALKFRFERGGEPMTGILACHDGRIVAYVNRCRHMPWPLDWDDGQFYTRDRDHFMCRTHGAVYEPSTGLCVLGPCAGAALEALAVIVEGDEVLVETG